MTRLVVVVLDFFEQIVTAGRVSSNENDLTEHELKDLAVGHFLGGKQRGFQI